VFFQPPPAYLRGVAAVDGYHFAGDAMFRGTTRPLGAILSYHVGGGLTADSAVVEVLGHEGEVIRTLAGGGEPGFHRIQWDLREDNPFQGQAGGGWFSPSGPEVLPGEYTVRIRLGEAEATGTVDVRPDPRVEITLQDRILKRNAVLDGNNLLVDLQAVGQGLGGLRDGLETLMPKIDEEGGASFSDLREMADSVEAEASRIGDALSEVEGASFSLFFMGLTRDAPTESDRVNLVRARREIDALVARFNGFVTGRVRALRERASGLGLGMHLEVSPIPRREG
jgi:hypothetical protein